MEEVAVAIKDFVEGAIGIDIIEMLIQILATLLLFLVVRHFFWNNITEYIEGRKNVMAKEYEDAALASTEAESLKLQAGNELNEIRLSAKEVIDDAKARGELEKTSIISKAKKDAEVVMENSRKEIKHEIEKARTTINDEIVSVAILMAEKVVKREIDASKHKELVDEVVKAVAN
ncbi:MAG: F0F1 ATP synthase subunit B [Candidatus Izemoplasma sp.]